MGNRPREAIRCVEAKLFFGIRKEVRFHILTRLFVGEEKRELGDTINDMGVFLSIRARHRGNVNVGEGGITQSS